MTGLDIALQRLLNQHIAQPTFNRPEDETAWLVAVQAKWGLGLRLQSVTDRDVEQASVW
jgi:hypothetical protein